MSSIAKCGKCGKEIDKRGIWQHEKNCRDKRYELKGEISQKFPENIGKSDTQIDTKTYDIAHETFNTNMKPGKEESSMSKMELKSYASEHENTKTEVLKFDSNSNIDEDHKAENPLSVFEKENQKSNSDALMALCGLALLAVTIYKIFKARENTSESLTSEIPGRI